MRFKGFWYDSLLISLAAVCAAAFTVVTFFIEPKLALAECIAVLAIVALMCFRVLSAKSRYKKFLLQAAKSLDYTDTEVLASLPFPVAVCDGDGYIKWAGESFIRDIAGGELTETSHIDEFSNGVGLQALLSEEKTGVFVGGRYYSVYTLSYESGGEKCCILYYLDYTELKQTELEYHMSRPYVILIKTDNLGDSRTDFRDSERAEMRSSIEAMLDEWSDSYGSTINRINDDRYMIVTERRNVERMTQDRFSVHDSVRNFEYKGRRANVTLSMGVATGEDIITADKLAANSGTAVKIAAGTITSDKVAAGQFKGYVFTGAVFQSSEAANTGMKLNSSSLRMWDSAHNQTVYLDGEGKSNLLTGTFQTRVSGHRVRISPDYQSYIIGGSETFVGDGLEFPAYNGSTAYYSHPAIASVIQSNQVGAMGELDLWSGHVSKNDPAAFMSLRSKPRKKGGTGSGGVTSRVHAVANTDYDEPDESKKSSAYLTLSGDSANGSEAWLGAQDANGEVGVGANIGTGYVYLGGYLGGITNRFTFHAQAAWKAWYPNPGSKIATGASMQVDCTFSPTKYGHYYVVANADSQWAGIIAHPMNTGGQSGFTLKLYNADQPCPVDVYAEFLAYLVK